MGKVIALKAPHASLKGLYDATRNGARRQDIRTPQWLVDAASETLGGSIPLDPSAHRSPRWHFAEENWSSRGLDRPWEKPTYVNSRFDVLALWLDYWQSEARRTGLPSLIIGPWRSHRYGGGFVDAIRGAEVVFFKAFAFAGQRNSSPFPVFLAARNVRFVRTAYEVDRQVWR